MVDLRSLLLPMTRWAHAKSRVGFAVVGVVPRADLSAWQNPLILPLGIPTNAPSPRQADVLVVVGRISHKLAPFLMRAYAGMSQPSSVLVFDFDRPASSARGQASVPSGEIRMDGTLPHSYSTVRSVAAILPVHVVVQSENPTPALVRRALRCLDVINANPPFSAAKTPGEAP